VSRAITGMAPAGAGTRDASPADEGPWADLPGRLRASGLRWTPQRRTLLEVLAQTTGHVTGAELVERCRELDPATIPSTVYRTLDVLEDLGIVSHAHGADGREEFHVLPAAEHGHLYCSACHAAWEVGLEEAQPLLDALERSRGFRVQLSHLSISGLCSECAASRA
jgi:Fur family ferric uptake transcriptional regulator